MHIVGHNRGRSTQSVGLRQRQARPILIRHQPPTGPLKAKGRGLRHGLATILNMPEAGRARLISVHRSRMIPAIDAR
jgi:hypothetical protein